jgi:hypothetical protein
MLNAVGLDHRLSAFLTQGGSAFLALLLVAQPASKALLLLTSAATGLTVLVQYPFVQNSETMLGIFGLALCLGWLLSKPWAPPSGWKLHSQSWIIRSFPAIRVIFILAYAAAAFSKWNSTFIFSDSSCGVDLPLTGLRFFVPGAELPEGITSMFPLLIALAESSVPLFLIFPRTRRWAVVLAIVLHLGMAISPTTPYLAFTAVVLAMVVLFLPAQTPEWAVRWMQSRLRKSRAGARMLVSLLALLGVVTLIAKQWFPMPSTPISLDYVFGLITVVPVGILLLVAIWKTRRAPVPRIIFRLGWAYVAFPVIVVLMAAQPYLGFGNVPSFTMFSNLHTENASSNHFLIPRLPISSVQDDFVEVQSPDFPSAPISWFEFTRKARNLPLGTRVTVVRDGVPMTVEITEASRRDLNAGWLMYKLVRTRPIETGCSW